MKTIQVEEALLVGVREGIRTLVQKMEKAGKTLQGDAFQPAPVFDRENPIEAIASLIKTASQTADQVAKAADVAKAAGDSLAKAKADAETERDEAIGIADSALATVEKLAKGQKPCRKCAGSGKVKDDDGEVESCPKCNGAAFVS